MSLRKLLQAALLMTLNISGVFRIFAFLNRKKALIVSYHGFKDGSLDDRSLIDVEGRRVDMQRFVKQLHYLSRRYRILPVKEIVDTISKKQILPNYTAAITFDDGYRDNYTLAFPRVAEKNIPVTLCVATSFIDGSNVPWDVFIPCSIEETKRPYIDIVTGDVRYHFDISNWYKKQKTFSEIMGLYRRSNAEEERSILDQLKRQLDDVNLQVKNGSPYQPLSWSHLKEMSLNNFTLACHTVNHVIISKHEPEEVRNEIVDSKEAIEKKIGINCDVFVYPIGRKEDINDVSRQILTESGFSCALTSSYGFVDSNSDLFALPRISIQGNTSFSEFLAKISGFRGFINRVCGI